jgi:hypothetical protein
MSAGPRPEAGRFNDEGSNRERRRAMTLMMKFLAGGAGLAAIAAAAPATAQYRHGYSQYGYGGVNTSVAAQQCTAAVQNRLYNRTGVGGVLGAIFGANTYSNARVLNVTQIVPRGSTVLVRGLASSGRYASNGYGRYGVGAYGALGYGYAQQADLSFRCNVDYRGFVRDVDINRR